MGESVTGLSSSGEASTLTNMTDSCCFMSFRLHSGKPPLLVCGVSDAVVGFHCRGVDISTRAADAEKSAESARGTADAERRGTQSRARVLNFRDEGGQSVQTSRRESAALSPLAVKHSGRSSGRARMATAAAPLLVPSPAEPFKATT